MAQLTLAAPPIVVDAQTILLRLPDGKGQVLCKAMPIASGGQSWVSQWLDVEYGRTIFFAFHSLRFA